MNRHPMRFIVRIDSGHTHCWWVRFQRSTRWQRSFPDRRHGGKAAALRAAQAWRDEREPHAAPTLGGVEVPPGHHYFRRTIHAGGVVWYCWLRVEDRRNKLCRRRVRKYGEAGARVECERWLERELQALRERLRRRSRWKPSPDARAALRRWQREEARRAA